MTNGKIQPFTSLDHSKHHCYTLSTTCTLFKLASEVGPRTTKLNYGFKIAFIIGSNRLGSKMQLLKLLRTVPEM